jgi:hypothetical protein
VLAVAAAVLDFASSGLPSSWLPAAAIDAISNREQIKKGTRTFSLCYIYLNKVSFELTEWKDGVRFDHQIDR